MTYHHLTNPEPSEFIKSLELSTRAARILTMHDIKTPEQFVELTEKTMEKWKGIGRITINEIRETINWMQRDTFPDRLNTAVAEVNYLIHHMPSGMRVTFDRDGFLVVYKQIGGRMPHDP